MKTYQRAKRAQHRSIEDPHGYPEYDDEMYLNAGEYDETDPENISFDDDLDIPVSELDDEPENTDNKEDEDNNYYDELEDFV